MKSKVITPGHCYELANHEGFGTQTIQFIEKKPSDKDDGTLVLVNDGTTNEEVLAVLIDRLTVLNNNFYCRENDIALTRLDEALLWLNKRTADRKARQVEGKRLP